MEPNRENKWAKEYLNILGLLVLVTLILRLWPILLLMLLALFFYALYRLVKAEKHVEPPQIIALPALPAPETEQNLLRNAFGLLQRRITEQVVATYPGAKWVWCGTHALDRFSAGESLTILLSGAGGYRTATVQVDNLCFRGLVYQSEVKEEPTVREPETGQQTRPPEEEKPTPVDYGLLAFEWVEANMQHLTTRQREAVEAGNTAFRISAEELPHGDSWVAVCAELVRNGFSVAEPLADGIQVQFDHLGKGV